MVYEFRFRFLVFRFPLSRIKISYFIRNCHSPTLFGVSRRNNLSIIHALMYIDFSYRPPKGEQGHTQLLTMIVFLLTELL